jgi:hypothetical protein
MLQTAIVHNRDNLKLEELLSKFAGSIKATTRIAPYQLPQLGASVFRLMMSYKGFAVHG